jgi:hypothetical protein
MKPLAVLRADRLTRLPAPFGGDRVRARSLDRAADSRGYGRASRAFGEHDANDLNCGPHHNPPANLKPNIYYKAQDLILGAWVGPSETSCAPDWIARAGFSRDEPVAWMVEDAACGC